MKPPVAQRTWKFALGQRVVHLKTRRAYFIVMHAHREFDLEPVYVYASPDDDPVSDGDVSWVRPASEMEDGRFVDSLGLQIDDFDYDTLNPGIRRVVRTLHQMGLDTTDSGDGKTHEHPCDLPFPYVHMLVAPSEMSGIANSLSSWIVVTLGLNLEPSGSEAGVRICATYDPFDDLATVSIFGLSDDMLPPERP